MLSYWPSLLGGMLIGLAAAMFFVLSGRIAGISGIVGGLLPPSRGDIDWRLAFIAGLIAAPAAAAVAGLTPAMTVTGNAALLVVAGLLVGFGTSVGSGCTSGHGVCGVARLSQRSIVATAVFMGAAAITVFVARHILSIG